MFSRWIPPAILLALTCVVMAILAWLGTQPLPHADAALANDMLTRTAHRWPNPSLDDYPESVQFTVIDETGRPVLSRGPVIVDQVEALGHHYSTLDIVVSGRPVGQLFIADPTPEAIRQREATMAITAGVGLAAMATVVLALLAWADLRILRPFARMREFARQVAAGMFDAPLKMDRNNAFGPFTEAFDLMRDELRMAQAREQELRDSRGTLVAQLGHDIRTPLATIRTTADLLRLGEVDPRTDRRLSMIMAKSDQIEALLDDLFQANRNELASIDFELVEHTTAELPGLLARADPYQLVRTIHIPEALVVYDEHRLLQVFDNILSNVRKYAAPPVWVTGLLEDDLLTLSLRDAGPGAPEDELALLTANGVRGSNSASHPGSGLGLYTAMWIMERMEGALAVRNSPEGGFEALVSMALAGRQDRIGRHEGVRAM